MNYRKLRADYVFPIASPPIKNGVLVVDEIGQIVEIASKNTYASESVEEYAGIFCPGFVNAHCHLELSHLKGQVPEHTGLVNFLKPIARIRNEFSEQQIHQAIIKAEDEMLENGIVAVGDIANDTTAFFQKKKGNLRYHSFIEIFNFNPTGAITSVEKASIVHKACPLNNGGGVSLSPHAPYTVSPELLQAIDAFNEQQQSITSIHNQECEAENELFQQGKGGFVELYEQLGVNIFDFFTPPQSNSIHYILPHLSPNRNILLVHNTYSTKEDIAFAQEYSKEIYWCFCPNANRYIENQLPNFEAFRQADAQICVGTDSLTSNWKLCILSELVSIQQHAPHIPLTELLQWATLNGAKFLNFEENLGSFEVGKTPAINLLEGVDLEQMRLVESTKVRRLV